MITPEDWAGMSAYDRKQWRKSDPAECAKLDAGKPAFVRVPDAPAPARTAAAPAPSPAELALAEAREQGRAEAVAISLAEVRAGICADLWACAFDRANGVTSSTPASNTSAAAAQLWANAFDKADSARLAADGATTTAPPSSSSAAIWDEAYRSIPSR